MIVSRRKISLHAVFIKKLEGIERSNLTNTLKNRVCLQTMMP